eukprot:TRINITY_DN1488_c0_g1_i4.p2 TRINITY_DN1488_c0_g1~~TRINITY_DN1488_c0_g1_i4.p2  ORF type:complete len:190 (+),score=37.43 TRINITY_DN1488_c0_g1_i4:399-968(+)
MRPSVIQDRSDGFARFLNAAKGRPAVRGLDCFRRLVPYTPRLPPRRSCETSESDGLSASMRSEAVRSASLQPSEPPPPPSPPPARVSAARPPFRELMSPVEVQPPQLAQLAAQAASPGGAGGVGARRLSSLSRDGSVARSGCLWACDVDRLLGWWRGTPARAPPSPLPAASHKRLETVEETPVQSVQAP